MIFIFLEKTIKKKEEKTLSCPAFKIVLFILRQYFISPNHLTSQKYMLIFQEMIISLIFCKENNSNHKNTIFGISSFACKIAKRSTCIIYRYTLAHTNISRLVSTLA